MRRGIGTGRTWRAIGGQTAHCGLAALALVAGLSAVTVARAADTPAGSRSSESEMMDAARRAAASGPSHPVNIGVPPADELRVLEARREVELKRLSEKLKRAVAARGPRPGEVITTPEWTTDVVAAPAEGLDLHQRSALGALPPASPSGTAPDFALRGRATILMVMTPADKRRPSAEVAADPILCVTAGCYVSNGPQAQAAFHSFGQSLGFAGRLGRGAGACNHSTACVFRDVDLGAELAMVQPIDLKFVHHDHREQREVSVDLSCRVVDGRLSCSRPVRTANYTLWIVPEHVARDVGPDRLAEAVGTGLATSRSAELPWAPQ